MGISESHAAHVGRVKVEFWLAGRALDPEAVSQVVGTSGDSVARAGDPRVAKNGLALPPSEEGIWRLSSRHRIQASGRALKDVNEHFRCLLQILLPHRDALVGLARNGRISFDVLWESSYLYAGTGPVLEADCIRGIAELGADVGFDICQIGAPSAGEAG
jgi:hypothetical protein